MMALSRKHWPSTANTFAISCSPLLSASTKAARPSPITIASKEPKSEASKTGGEITAAKRLYQKVDLRNAVVTGDALHCERENMLIVIENDGDFAVMMQKKLVGFEVGADEGGRVMCAARIRPHGELAECPAVRVDGTLRVGAGGEVGEKGVGKGGNAYGYGDWWSWGTAFGTVPHSC